MKYLKKFPTRAEYDAYMATNENYPFVGYIEDERKVEYDDDPYTIYAGLKGDGKAYIITEYYPNIYDQIEFLFTPAGGNQMIFGARKDMQCLLLYSDSDWGYVTWNLDSTAQAYFDTQYAMTLGLFPKEDGSYVSMLKATHATKGETLITTYPTPPNEVVSSFPLFVMASNGNNYSTVDNRIFRGTLHYLKITDSRTGSVKLDLVPATRNGAAGLLDRVTLKFYGNSAANGSFSVVEG
jgi:hypothetical protein